MRLLTLLSGLRKETAPAIVGTSTVQAGAVLGLNPSGLVDPVFVSVDGGNSASTYPFAPGSKIDGGKS